MMKKSFYVFVIVALAGLMATNASANSMFMDEFTGGPSENWTNTAAATYTNNQADFTGTTDPERDYLRTVDADYATEDFIATVDLTNGDNWSGCVFFGMGDGTPVGESGAYEPKTGSYVLIRLNGGGAGDHTVEIGSDVAESVTFGDDPLPTGTTLGFMLSWEAATSTVTFGLDADDDDDYYGPYDYTYSFVNTNLASAPTRLFIGGSNGAGADNFNVAAAAVPEPNTLMLLLGGLLGLIAVWRKQK